MLPESLESMTLSHMEKVTDSAADGRDEQIGERESGIVQIVGGDSPRTVAFRDRGLYGRGDLADEVYDFLN